MTFEVAPGTDVGHLLMNLSLQPLVVLLETIANTPVKTQEQIIGGYIFGAVFALFPLIVTYIVLAIHQRTFRPRVNGYDAVLRIMPFLGLCFMALGLVMIGIFVFDFDILKTNEIIVMISIAVVAPIIGILLFLRKRIACWIFATLMIALGVFMIVTGIPLIPGEGIIYVLTSVYPFLISYGFIKLGIKMKQISDSK